jgi:hypothetical protein
MRLWRQLSRRCRAYVSIRQHTSAYVSIRYLLTALPPLPRRCLSHPRPLRSPRCPRLAGGPFSLATPLKHLPHLPHLQHLQNPRSSVSLSSCTHLHAPASLARKLKLLQLVCVRASLNSNSRRYVCCCCWGAEAAARFPC